MSFRIPAGPLTPKLLAAWLLFFFLSTSTGSANAAKNEATAASAKVDQLFAWLTRGVQPGAGVMVIRGGKIVHQATYGYANVEGHVPLTVQSTFRLDSVSKQFTAMAVMILKEDGRLAYDDPITRFLPELATYPGVTIRHLLTHTGGLPDYYDVIDTSHGWPTNADARKLLGQMAKPVFPPGTRYEYSNPGYDMLAQIVEVASGMQFADFVRKRIFTPLRMQHSLVHDHTRPVVPRRVLGYDSTGNGYRLNDEHPLNGIVGSGGVFSTLGDLFLWDQALYGTRLVSRPTLDEAFTPAVLKNGEKIDYGFGWRISDYRGVRRIEHGGSWVGFRTHIARHPGIGLTIVILSNRSDMQPEEYIDRITDIYLRKKTDAVTEPEPLLERNVDVQMRDGVMLRADVYRPPRSGRFPVLVFRTPYGKHNAAHEDQIHVKAVQRGYAVVLQDVRGRYASAGIFAPYRQEGADGYDTIEWAARQPWSNGQVGTFGLSYPGAVQWLAAIESPPHLRAMVPAMTFSSPRNFFYANGVFDLSWLPWIYLNIAPDARHRLDLPGIRDTDEAEEAWPSVAREYLSWLPLRELPYLRREAPFYFEWLVHPPEDPWWDFAELRNRYSNVSAAVLNLSGWYDEAYGPEGATTNFNGLMASRAGDRDARTNLILGPWVHGVSSTRARRTGELDFGPEAAIDYDAVVLDFLDRHVRGVDNEFTNAAPVRHFIMGANQWRDEVRWPPAGAITQRLYFTSSKGGKRMQLRSSAESRSATRSEFTADPRNPVLDPHAEFGPHDYQQLQARKDVLTFDTQTLQQDLVVAGAVVAQMYVSCDCRDFDLWVRLQDVYPDGRAFNLMSPGNDVLRASYREAGGRRLLEPGRTYLLELPTLLTSISFAKGHRIRAQISASFAPHLSRNLQTGESEASSAEARPAHIAIHQGGREASRLLLPVLNRLN